ncbi:hypothetical protein CgunFtcFv8_011376 [Champsocephalus gunnari]|uniref:Zinc finger MYM-type protein 4-like n=1 Tax=Champsocephalus gunnari TaxID=52237 RepID=A0AAN8HIC1_CHAGU|nr:hypothetical protein CgunFtcFv8_011376 [Champsocephalus gunnari]
MALCKDSCSYCSGFSTKMLHSHYGGRMEEFCRPHCMSQYTVLYYGMGRCDSCRKQGSMTEKLQCLGSVRNFCNLPCLLQYCQLHFETSHSSSNGTGTAPQTPYAPTQPHHSSKMNPVIADVVSLANGSATQPSVSADTALTGTLPTTNIDAKNLDHASTQTDAMQGPSSRRRQMKNKSVLCRPFTVDQESMCQLLSPSAESAGVLPPSMSVSVGGENVRVLLVPVPVPVPVFIPVPMSMYSQYTPFPMAMPVPVPVPILVPPQKKETRDTAVQSEPHAVTEEQQRDVSTADQRSPHSGDMESEVVAPMIREVEETEKTVQADLPLTVSSERSTESSDPQLSTQPEVTTTTSEPPTTSAELQPPSSPLMDLETDVPTESLDQKPAAPQRGVKRSRDPYSSRKRSRRRTGSLNHSAVRTPPASKLNHVYGVKAWRSWVQQQNQQPTRSNMVDVKEDVLQCDSAELSFALSHFITDVRRPNGETYSPDSIFYLCLGIQQYLFSKGRIENIFTDELYSQFTTKISGMLQLWKPKLLVPSGAAVSSRVVESYLWECKQLGAYSPIVLLNTLLFFCSKNFGFTTLEQHQSVSFTNFTRLSKSCNKPGKVLYLRYQRSSKDPHHTERYRKRQGEEEMLEMLENVANPLHCPVRLYEFYLSRCPESVQTRSDVFFLQPEEVVHTHRSVCAPTLKKHTSDT